MDTIIDDIQNDNEYFHRPSLNVRVKAMFIDMIVVILLMYLATFLLSKFNVESGSIKASVLALILLYEPISVALGSTIGQRMMNLRVSQYQGLKEHSLKLNIGFGYSLLRYITKIIFGFPSLLTVHASNYGQALHDKISASIVHFK